MTDINVKDFVELREFLKWKRENPEEYKEFLKDIKDFYIDLTKLLKEVTEEAGHLY